MTFKESDAQTREEDRRPFAELPEIEPPKPVNTPVWDIETAVYIDDLMELMRRRR